MIKGMKRKNPVFIRQDAPNLPKLKIKWRKPKGRHSKMRLSLIGHRPRVKIGYKNENSLRYTRNGLKLTHISNMNELLKINPKEEMIIIASTMGLKKRKEIFAKAKELNVKILHIKDPDTYVKKKQEKMSKLKQERTERMNKQQEQEKKKEKQKQKEQVKDEESKKKEEQKEKKKVLEKGLN